MRFKANNNNVIEIVQGSTYTDTVEVDIDLTGFTVVSMLRDLSGALQGTFACTIDLTQAPTKSIISRELSQLETEDLIITDSVNHVWGIKLVAADGKVLPEIQGGARILPRVVY